MLKIKVFAVLSLLALGAAAANAQVSQATAIEALDEVNAIRAASGLPPYQRDDGLTVAAKAAATFRAARFIAGHTTNDFAFLPAGASAPAAGCAANGPEHGFMACAMFDDYQFAGAAFVIGIDGRAYCHLFVRGGTGRTLGQRVPIFARPLKAHPDTTAKPVAPTVAPAPTDPPATCANGTCAGGSCGTASRLFQPFGGRFRR